jgi:hypothetical protein
MKTIGGNKLLIHGGCTRESPHWLTDMYLVNIAEYPEMARDGVRWYRLEARAWQPTNSQPLGRESHAAVFTQVCSSGHTKEKEARLGQPPSAVDTYPGAIGRTEWCQGQVVIFGGKT